jgi:hypothetical protein
VEATKRREKITNAGTKTRLNLLQMAQCLSMLEKNWASLNTKRPKAAGLILGDRCDFACECMRCLATWVLTLTRYCMRITGIICRLWAKLSLRLPELSRQLNPDIEYIVAGVYQVSGKLNMHNLISGAVVCISYSRFSAFDGAKEKGCRIRNF